MRIALLQVASVGDKEKNLARIEPIIREAAANGATLIVLPEATMYAFGEGRLDVQAEELDGPFATAVNALATELGVTIACGMFTPADRVDGKNRVHNTVLVTSAELHAGYHKMHTYDAFDYAESDTVKPGDELFTFSHDGLTVGVATCFDIRFPELFKDLARRGAYLVIVPTSWADGENKLDHWRTLTVARALDAGVFIAAADQPRPGGRNRLGQAEGPLGVGHSVVVAPDGTRVAEAGVAEEILYADIDPADVDSVRAALPLLGKRPRA